MDNSLVSPHLREYIEAMFKDMVYEYTRRTQWDRDKSRLLHELENRGSRVLTIDLPDLCKHFDKCLNRGLYSPSGLYLGSMSRRARVPVFTQDLHLQIFDKEGFLRECPSISAISAIRQIYKGLTKWKAPCAEWRTNDEVVNFAVIERSLRSPTLHWEGDDLGVHNHGYKHRGNSRFCNDPDSDSQVVQPEFGMLDARDGGRKDLYLDRSISTILSATADRIAAQFGSFSTEVEGIDLPKHGRGRVSDQEKHISKYAFTNWPEKLNRTFPFDLYGAVNFDDVVGEDIHGRWINHEPPSKLIAVPKTQKGPRLIASEPASHQWIQQLLWRQIQTRLPKTVLNDCIDFQNQGRNQELARFGSITGSYATVDLSSASDRLTCWTLERVLGANQEFLERIHACRTRWIKNAINPYQWQYLSLRKAFSQGNACTFPVQSIVYSIFAIAAVLHSREMKVSTASLKWASTRVRVFGDDIIVPEYALVSLFHILEANQLLVNSTKTFFTETSSRVGGFRESCGGDYYLGHDVTPAYIKAFGTELDHEMAMSAVEASNNLHARGLWHLARWQGQQVGPKVNGLIVHAIDPNGLPRGRFGLYSFSGATSHHLKRRYNLALQRDEVLSYKLVSKVKRVKSETTDGLFQYFIERPNPETKWESGTIVGNSSVMRRGWEPSEEITCDSGYAGIHWNR